VLRALRRVASELPCTEVPSARCGAPGELCALDRRCFDQSVYGCNAGGAGALCRFCGFSRPNAEPFPPCPWEPPDGAADSAPPAHHVVSKEIIGIVIVRERCPTQCTSEPFAWCVYNADCVDGRQGCGAGGQSLCQQCGGSLGLTGGQACGISKLGVSDSMLAESMRQSVVRRLASSVPNLAGDTSVQAYVEGHGAGGTMVTVRMLRVESDSDNMELILRAMIEAPETASNQSSRRMDAAGTNQSSGGVPTLLSGYSYVFHSAATGENALVSAVSDALGIESSRMYTNTWRVRSFGNPPPDPAVPWLVALASVSGLLCCWCCIRSCWRLLKKRTSRGRMSRGELQEKSSVLDMVEQAALAAATVRQTTAAAVRGAATGVNAALAVAKRGIDRLNFDNMERLAGAGAELRTMLGGIKIAGSFIRRRQEEGSAEASVSVSRRRSHLSSDEGLEDVIRTYDGGIEVMRGGNLVNLSRPYGEQIVAHGLVEPAERRDRQVAAMEECRDIGSPALIAISLTRYITSSLLPTELGLLPRGRDILPWEIY